MLNLCKTDVCTGSELRRNTDSELLTVINYSLLLSNMRSISKDIKIDWVVTLLHTSCNGRLFKFWPDLVSVILSLTQLARWKTLYSWPNLVSVILFLTHLASARKTLVLLFPVPKQVERNVSWSWISSCTSSWLDFDMLTLVYCLLLTRQFLKPRG